MSPVGKYPAYTDLTVVGNQPHRYINLSALLGSRRVAGLREDFFLISGRADFPPQPADIRYPPPPGDGTAIKKRRCANAAQTSQE